MKLFTEEGLNIERLPLLETLMSLGNGYMGVRGYLEEFEYPDTVRGNYINGIYERVPMVHAEWAYGFPLEADRMPNLVDPLKITIILDGERVVIEGKIKNFKRELSFKEGLSRRSYNFQTENGKIASINFEQLISLSNTNLRTWSLNILYDGEIEVINHFNSKINNVSSDKDPRIAPTKIPLVEVIKSQYESNVGDIWIKTIKSELNIKMNFVDEGEFSSSSYMNDNDLNIHFSSYGKLQINRMIRYWDDVRNSNSDFIPKDEIYKEQREYLQDYYRKCSIDFLDNKELDDAMDFMEFHILQSTTRDKHGNISAKGLSGEGYEGHFFWDTEIFLFPCWLFWDEERAKNLLLYRYGILDAARARATEMGHRKGACFPWRTISGIESSGYFPAGSAQYHINFDIAYTFIQWWLANKDADFLVKYTMEIILETARTALEIGSFQSDGFHIHAVTGPDEYTAMVSDNYYTNKMAQYNLKWAVKLWNMLEEERSDDFKRLKEKLHIRDDEIQRMESAAKEMFFIYDEIKGIWAQDYTFLTKPYWPIENSLKPLLLYYHPLTIYRYQILKQADTVLAQYLMSDDDEEVIRRTFYYYEDINTHDSSLSKCVSGLMACKLKDDNLAYNHFMDSVYMDLKDLNHNTNDGLHMANLGGSLISVLKGFGGLRIDEEGLYIDPYVPKKLGRVRFRFTWRKALLEVFIDGENVDIKKISGPAVEVILRGKKTTIGQKAVLFDLDGVLTGTSDNHYEAWKQLSKDLGQNLPEEFRDRVRGISRMDAIEIILDYFGLECSREEKIRFAERKNEYYKKSIESFTSDNLYTGVVELLEKLKDIGIKIGLVSASKNAPHLIKSMGIERYFDAIADPEKIERGKPYPDPFLVAAKMLNVDPADCLGVEDARAGIESIKAAGMTALGIGYEELGLAIAVYSTIQEASQYIIDWGKGNHGSDNFK